MVSRKMRARLFADSEDDFEISSQSPTVQTLDEGVTPTWRWRVTPRRIGRDKVLTLAIDAIIVVRDLGVEQIYEEELSIRVLEQTLDVTVNPVYSSRLLIRNHWEWLMATLVVPVTWGVINRYGKRPRKRIGTRSQAQSDDRNEQS